MTLSGLIRHVTEEGDTYYISARSDRFDVKPLSHSELVSFVQSPQTNIQIKISNVNVTPDNLEEDIPRTVTFTIGAAPIYGLVDGGWLPMPWAHREVAYIDSNIVIGIEKMLMDTTPKNETLQHFLGVDTQLVSPLFYALEGVAKRPVTEIEFNTELDRAEYVLQGLLPIEKIEFLNKKQRSEMYDILRQQSRAAAMKLTTAVVPLVADQLDKKNRPHIEKKLLLLAAENNLAVNSFVVVALLSCVYDSIKGNHNRAQTPGRSVIKPKKKYDERTAYGAISDLYMLEFLHNIQAIAPKKSRVFYTQDVGLAALWTAMQPCQRTVINHPNGRKNVRIESPLDNGLFPALLLDETLQLKQRLIDFSQR